MNFFNGCFNWMIQHLYEKRLFHPNIHEILVVSGNQVYPKCWIFFVFEGLITDCYNEWKVN